MSANKKSEHLQKVEKERSARLKQNNEQESPLNGFAQTWPQHSLEKVTLIENASVNLKRSAVQQIQKQAGNVAVQRYLYDSPRLINNEKQISLQPTTIVQMKEQEGEITSPEIELMEDFASGISKAKEYVGYAKTCIEYWNKWYSMPPEVKEVADNLQKIADTLNQKFGLITTTVEYTRKIYPLATSFWDLAAKTRALSSGNAKDIAAWAQTVGTVNEAAEPIKGWLSSLGLKGSLIAARASFYISILSAYIEIGVKAIEYVESVSEAYARKVERATYATPSNEVREKEKEYLSQSLPTPWHSAAEIRSREKAEKEAEIAAYEHRSAYEAKLSQAQTKFLETYKENRPKLVSKIEQAIKRKEKSTYVPGQDTKEQAWRSCLTIGAYEGYGEAETVEPEPIKTPIKDKEAKVEIQLFQEIEPPCPYFEELYSIDPDFDILKSKR
jgi:hypothetical protein